MTMKRLSKNKKLSNIDIKICFVYVTLFLVHFSTTKADERQNNNKPPNVIIIMADDMVNIFVDISSNNLFNDFFFLGPDY